MKRVAKTSSTLFLAIALPATAVLHAQQPTLTVSIDAALLSKQKPRAAMSTLKTLGWSSVTYNAREEMITLKARDGSSGLVQYRKGVLLFAGFNVPSRPAVTADLVRTAFHLPYLPAPSQQWQQGVRWQLLGETPREVEGSINNVETHFGVKYAPERVIKQWEREG